MQLDVLHVQIKATIKKIFDEVEADGEDEDEVHTKLADILALIDDAGMSTRTRSLRKRYSRWTVQKKLRQ